MNTKSLSKTAPRKIEWGRLAFYVAILAFVIYALIVSFTYPSSIGGFPIGVAIPTIILLVLTILAIWFPSLGRESDVLKMDSVQAPKELVKAAQEAEDAESELKSISSGKMVLGTMALATLLVILTIYLGTYIAVPLCIFVYLKFLARHSWKVSLIYPIVLAGLLWLIFEKATELGLYEGALFGGRL